MKTLVNLIRSEGKNDFGFRMLGAVIGLSLCFNFVPINQEGLLLMGLAIMLGLVFWGIGINLILYFIADLLKLIFLDLSKEGIYRGLIIGHSILILTFLSANGVEVIKQRISFILLMEAFSILVSILLLIRIRKGNMV
jgi:hypothetical protein